MVVRTEDGRQKLVLARKPDGCWPRCASKYADHIPLHRLECILGRHGIDLARSTMCGWMAHIAAMLRPVVEWIAEEVRRWMMIHTDATKMPYLDELVPGKTVSGQMWVYVGDRNHPFHVFDPPP